MKRTLMAFVLIFALVKIGLPSDSNYTIKSNPDGKIGSFIWTVGGAFGGGSVRDEFPSYHERERYTLRSYSALSQLQCPMSSKTTFIIQLDYLHEKIGSAGIYEGTTSGFKVGMYLKLFSK